MVIKYYIISNLQQMKTRYKAEKYASSEAGLECHKLYMKAKKENTWLSGKRDLKLIVI